MAPSLRYILLAAGSFWVAACGGSSSVTPLSGFRYATDPATYTVGTAVAPNEPQFDGGSATTFEVAPALPAGLALSPVTGRITGTPTEAAATAAYVITASNSVSTLAAEVAITVFDRAPVITYAATTQTLVAGIGMTPLVPESTGGAPVSWQVQPVLPAGLTLDPEVGIITGTPATAAATGSYTITVGNTGGSDTVELTIEVLDAGAAISSQPQAVTRTVGSTATVSVTANGPDPLDYQWQRDGVALPGANGSSYTTSTLTSDDDGARHQVRISAGIWPAADSRVVLVGAVGGTFAAINALPLSRADATVTELADGRVLIAGGRNTPTLLLGDAAIYRPETSFFAGSGPMVVTRAEHSAVRLSDGRVLITGNTTADNRAELFDPATDSFTAASGLMTAARRGHTMTLLADGRVLLVGGVDGVTSLASAELFDPVAGTFAATGGLAEARHGHRAVRLGDGTVLVVGGLSPALASAEIYDPATGQFRGAGAMIDARSDHVAELLPDGRVLVAGGRDGATVLNTAEAYDPVGGSFDPVGTMTVARSGAAARPLANGRILVAGGLDASSAALASAEVFDVPTGSFVATGSLVTVRSQLVLAALPTGRILVPGGKNNGSSPIATCEVFDPQLVTPRTLSRTAPLRFQRDGLAAATLADGRALVAGGRVAGLGTVTFAEVHDPLTSTWQPVGRLSSPRNGGVATLLADGRVLVCTGYSATMQPMATAELFDPSTDEFAPAGPLAEGRAEAVVRRLPNGQVLVAGGWAAGGIIASAELFDPATGTFRATASMTTARRGATATLLADGRVLVVGGLDSNLAPLASTEIYDPRAGTFAAAAPMGDPRGNHAAVRLADGRVLVVGGGAVATALVSAELFNPTSGSWQAAGAMATGRQLAAAVRLKDGRVAVLGGVSPTLQPLGTVEIFDPAANTFAAGGDMSVARRGARVCDLPLLGRALVVGGADSAVVELLR